jgi:hypothetical protein
MNCPSCNNELSEVNIYFSFTDKSNPKLTKCPNCNCKLNINQVFKMSSSYEKKYHKTFKIKLIPMEA